MPDLPPSTPKYQVEIHDGRGVVIGDGAQVTQVIQAAPTLEIPSPPEPERPSEVAEFIGRETELAGYAGRLRTSHLAVIVGEPGVGKTWLAARLARQFAAPEQVFWYAFHEGATGGAGIEALIWKLAAFLAQRGQDDLWRMLQNARLTGSQPQPAEVLFDYLIQLLRGRGYLLCLDDFQHVDEDPLVGRLVQRLTAAVTAGEISLILTSRRIPSFARAIEPLAGLSLADAQSLLTARGLSLAADLAADLHAHTAGNPQLLTLAVNALRGCADPARLVVRLAEERDIARYLLDEVHKCLSKDEQAVMSAISALLGYSGTRDAIEAILDDDAWEALTSLGDRYLLTVTEGARSRSDGAQDAILRYGPNRLLDDQHRREYGQHAIVQAFYYGQLGRRQRREMHRRAGAYYEREEPDLLKAASHYQRAEEPEAAARLATADVWALINQGQAGALRRLLDQLTAQQMNAELWARVNIARGQVYALHRESQLARQSFEQGLAVLEGLAASPEFRELASKQIDKTAQSASRARLRQELTEHFSEEELRTLCFDLGLDYEDLPAQGKAGKARELVAQVERGEKVVALIALCHRARPNVAWEEGDATSRPDNLPEWFVELKARACREMGVLLTNDSPVDALVWLSRGLDLFPGARTAATAMLLIQAGLAHINMGNFLDAQGALEEGMELLPKGPSHWRAAGLINLGNVCYQLGHAEKCKDYWRQALEISLELGNYWQVVSARHNLAIQMEIAGHWDKALDEYQAALALARQLGSRTHQVNLALSLGIIRTKQGQDEAALALLYDCQRVAKEHSLQHQLVFIMTSLADLHWRRNEFVAAKPLLAEAEAIALEMTFKDQLPEIYRGRAQVQLAQGQIGWAREDAEHSVKLAHELGLENEEGMSLRILGQVLLASGQYVAAVATFEQSLAILTGRDPYETARTQTTLGLAHMAGGDEPRGVALLQEARTTFRTLGARRDLAAIDGFLH